MRNRITIMVMSALLALGAVACDDTADGVETDTEQIGDEIEQEADDAAEELDDIDVEADVDAEADGE